MAEWTVTLDSKEWMKLLDDIKYSNPKSHALLEKNIKVTEEQNG